MELPSIDNYAGREQAYVKHALLGNYLIDWAYKVGSAWDALAYVDGFAGPWDVRDPHFADSSFGIATSALLNVKQGLADRGRTLRTRSIFVEKDPDAYVGLDNYVVEQREKGRDVCAFHGEFESHIPDICQKIDELGKSTFRFVFLDPKGWSGMPMASLKPLLTNRSCEVLVTLMTSDLIRFLKEEDRAQSYLSLFGRSEVLDGLRLLAGKDGEQAEQAVREYCISLKQMCGFHYVSQAAILEPKAEGIRYFLIFATNHPLGIEVFKKAENKAAKIQDDVRARAKNGNSLQNEFAFGSECLRTTKVQTLRDTYIRRARKKVYKKLKEANRNAIPFCELFCSAMAFPLVNPDDLCMWIKELADSGIVSIKYGDAGQHRKPSINREDLIIINDPSMISLG